MMGQVRSCRQRSLLLLKIFKIRIPHTCLLYSEKVWRINESKPRRPVERKVSAGWHSSRSRDPTAGGQLREFREEHGVISEPHWNNCAGVLAFCEDGDALMHEISQGDQRYSFEETQGKLDRQRGFGPTTCAKFHGDNPSPCEECPHWGKITSPIVLGHRPEPAVAAVSKGVATLNQWELTKGGARKPNSYNNAAVALSQLEIKFSHDIFHNKKIVVGDIAENISGELSDAICRALRDEIIARFRFDPGKENVQEAAERACEIHRFDPVCDYLDGLQWDGQKRLDTWVIRYLGAEDTPLNRAFGRKMLVAAVRRARQPGCKFDYVPCWKARRARVNRLL
jgi:hypothetical protein